MLESWLNHKLLQEQNLRQYIGDVDYKGYSSASLLSKLTDLREKIKKENRIRRIKYSYQGSEGLN